MLRHPGRYLVESVTELATPSTNKASGMGSDRGVNLMHSNGSALEDKDLAKRLDHYSLESIIDLKISRFLDQIGTFYPENLYAMIMQETEKPLLHQILRRTGGNQVHAARILGINRNTLRKKMKTYGFR
jgi:DNA-binding protein Fis